VAVIEKADTVTAKMLRDATRHVKALREAIVWFPREEEAKNGVVEYEEFLKEVVVTAVAKLKKIPKEKVAEASEETPASKCNRGPLREPSLSLTQTNMFHLPLQEGEVPRVQRRSRQHPSLLLGMWRRSGHCTSNCFRWRLERQMLHL
jgi:hypothetical protein